MGSETDNSGRGDRHKDQPINKITDKPNLLPIPTEKGRKKEAPSSLAKAIAQREVDEMKRERRILQSKTREPKEAVEVLDFHLRILDNLLEKNDTISPSVQAHHEHTLDIIKKMDDQTFLKTFITDPVQRAEVTASSPEMKDTIKKGKQLLVAKEELEKEVQPDVFAHIYDTFKNAHKLATERNVSPEQLYEDDRLYEELIRETFSPEQYAGRIVYALGSSTPESIIKANVKFNIRREAIEGGQGDLVEETIENTTNQKMKAAKEHPSFPAYMAHYEQQFAATIDATQTHARSQILRFWGEEALDKFPDSLRSGLGLSDPENAQQKIAESYSHLGLLLGKGERYEESLTPFTRAVELAPDNAKYRSYLGDTYGEMGNYTAAAEQYAYATTLLPKNVIPFDKLSYAHFQLGNYEEAAEATRQAIALSNPETDKSRLAQRYDSLGLALGNLQREEDSIIATQKAVELDPQNPTYINDLGVAYYDNGDYEEALSMQQKAVELAPENAQYWCNLGNTYDTLKNYEGAVEAHQKAIELSDPEKEKNELADRYNNLAYSLRKSDRSEEALSPQQKAVELTPEDKTCWSGLGYTYGKLEQFEEAEKAFRRALELDPDGMFHRGNVGEMQYRLGRLEEAERTLTQAIAHKSYLPEPYYYLALTKERLGEVEAVKPLLQQAIDQTDSELDEELIEKINQEMREMEEKN